MKKLPDITNEPSSSSFNTKSNRDDLSKSCTTSLRMSIDDAEMAEEFKDELNNIEEIMVLTEGPACLSRDSSSFDLRGDGDCFTSNTSIILAAPAVCHEPNKEVKDFVQKRILMKHIINLPRILSSSSMRGTMDFSDSLPPFSVPLSICNKQEETEEIAEDVEDTIENIIQDIIEELTEDDESYTTESSEEDERSEYLDEPLEYLDEPLEYLNKPLKYLTEPLGYSTGSVKLFDKKKKEYLDESHKEVLETKNDDAEIIELLNSLTSVKEEIKSEIKECEDARKYGLRKYSDKLSISSSNTSGSKNLMDMNLSADSLSLTCLTEEEQMIMDERVAELSEQDIDHFTEMLEIATAYLPPNFCRNYNQYQKILTVLFELDETADNTEEDEPLPQFRRRN